MPKKKWIFYLDFLYFEKIKHKIAEYYQGAF